MSNNHNCNNHTESFCGFQSLALAIEYLESIPYLYSSNYSTSTILVWVPTSEVCSSEFYNSLEEIVCKKCGRVTASTSDSSTSLEMQVINRCLKLPKYNDIVQCKVVYNFINTILASCSNESIVKYRNEIFGPYNYCLEKCCINLKDRGNKIINNNIIIKNLESFVWTPTVS